MVSIILILIVIAIVGLVVATSIRIVPQAEAYVVERLGAYMETWEVGFHVKVPFMDKVAAYVPLREQVEDFPPQPVITKDNVTMKIDTVVYYQITDPKLFCYGVDNPIKAIENLTATTLRNIIGDLELDETLTSRETINTKMRAALDEATDPWGIKVNRVELKNIIPPEEIQDAMERQMKAERERREAILRAEATKEKEIKEAEGRAEAIRATRKAEADGIKFVKAAEAEGIKSIKNAEADDTVIRLKSLDAFAKAADGKATKIIIPSEIQGVAGLVSSVTEIAKDVKPTTKANK